MLELIGRAPGDNNIDNMAELCPYTSASLVILMKLSSPLALVFLAQDDGNDRLL